MRRGQPPLALEGAMLGAGVNLAAAHLRQREQKRILNYTFEAGMCMKTKDRKTQCPNRNRLIVPRFRHLRRIERYFAENCCFCTTACQVHADFRGFPRVPRSERSAPSRFSRRCRMGTSWWAAASRSGEARKSRKAAERALRYLSKTIEKPQGWRASLALRFKNDRRAARLESEPCATLKRPGRRGSR